MQYVGIDENTNTSIRELNDSKTSGNLKSVYAMRVSHSNLASNAVKHPPNTAKAKRAHLKSAVPRSSKPTNLTIYEQTIGNNMSQQDIGTIPVDRRQGINGKNGMMSTLSSKQTVLNNTGKPPMGQQRNASQLNYNHSNTIQHHTNNDQTQATLRTNTIANPVGYMTNISQTLLSSAS